MADDDTATFTRACEAADLLLTLTRKMAKGPLAAAVKITGDKADGFKNIVALEIAGSMAIDRLLASYVKLALAEAQKLPDKDDQMRHLMQAVANPVVGGVLAFTDDMPPAMQHDFCRLLVAHLGEGVSARQRSKKERETGRGH